MSNWGARLISILKATGDFDRLNDLLKAAAVAYEQGIQSVGQYAIELDSGEAAIFRQHLETLRERLAAAGSPAAWNEIEASFRGELREYRDRNQASLSRLRAEIKAAADAMQIFANSVATTGANHEEQLNHAVGRLTSLAQACPAGELQQTILATTGDISSSLDAMQRSHKLAVAQLQDEIRLLHKQIDVKRRSLDLDRETGVWNRQKLDAHISALIENEQNFSVLLVCIRNYKWLDQRHSHNQISCAFKALLQRFESALTEGATIGRWEEDQFAAVLEQNGALTAASCRETAMRLSGQYSVQENGLSHNVKLQATAGIVDCPAGYSAALLHQHIAQMTQALAHG